MRERSSGAGHGPAGSRGRRRWPTEIGLIRAARGGAHDALEELCRRYWSLAYLAGLSQLGDHSLAEDVAQETLNDATRNLHRFKVGRPFDRWLLTIANRRATDLLRSRASLAASLTVDGDTEYLESGRPSPETRTVLTEALAEMKPEWRQVVCLHRLRGFTIDEIATRLRLPAGTVSSRLSRADRWLQTQLEGLYE